MSPDQTIAHEKKKKKKITLEPNEAVHFFLVKQQAKRQQRSIRKERKNFISSLVVCKNVLLLAISA